MARPGHLRRGRRGPHAGDGQRERAGDLGSRRGVDYEEVRVAWRRRDRPEIEKLSGQRHVPLLVIEKDAICDSLRIIEHLEWRRSEQL